MKSPLLKDMQKYLSPLSDHKPSPESVPPHPWFLISQDGNQWMATRPDFLNLQESNAGFGDTVEMAISDLYCQEAD